MADKVNPYIAGAPVLEARMFFGREDVFSWIERSLAGKYVDHILVIHGQRRVGKTSVLKHLPSRLPETYITTFIDLQGRVSTTLDRFLWWLAREITKSLDEHGIELRRPEREAFTQDTDYFENQFLTALEEKLGDKNLLLTFDEFDTLTTTAAQEGLALPFLAILKRLMEHEKLNFIFSIGSAGRKLENMQATYTAFFKQALYKKISFLNKQDAQDLIAQPVESIMDYDQAAVDYIFDITSGHPYFIQLLCHELFSTCQKTDNWEVSRHTVEEVLGAVIERGTVNLKFVWDEATELEKWVLASLALFESGTDISTLEGHLRKERVRFTHQDLETALLNLRHKDVLTTDNRFVIHLMRLWLRQNRSMDQVRDELEEVDPIVSRFLEIGQEFQDNGEFEQAIEAYQRALEASPHNIEARLGLGAASLARGDFGEAANVYESVLEISPEDVAAQAGYCDAYMALGDLEVAFKRLEEAEFAYQKVLQTSPKHAGGLRRMAELHHRRAVQAIVGGEQAAVIELEKAKRFAPDDKFFTDLIDELIALSDGDKELSEVLLSWGNKAFELDLLDEAGDLFNAFTDAGGDPGEVAEYLEHIEAQVRKKRIRNYQQQADRMRRLRRYDEAIGALETVLSLNPLDPEQIHQTIEELRSEQHSETVVTAPAPKPLWRRWWLWAGMVILAILGIWQIQPGSPLRVALSDPTPTITPIRTPLPTVTYTPIPTAIPEPTAIPMQWRRQDSGLFLNRDGITSILIHPSDDEVMYASTARAGVYKTINGGVTWFPIHNGLDHGWIRNLVLNPRDPDEVFAGAIQGGLYRTINGGDSWEFLETGVTDFGWESQVTINPEDPDQLVYHTGNDLSVSWDGGENWVVRDWEMWGLMGGEEGEENLRMIEDLAFNPRKGELILVGRDHEPTGPSEHHRQTIRLSADNGASWTTVFQGEPGSVNGTLFVSPYREELFLYYLIVDDEQYVLISEDDGQSWGEWFEDNPVLPMASSVDGTLFTAFEHGIMRFHEQNVDWQLFEFSDGRNFYASLISLSESNSDLMVLGGRSVLISTDGGVTWVERLNGLPAADTEIAHTGNGDEMFLMERQCDTYKCRHPEFRFFKVDLGQGTLEFLSSGPCGENPESDWEMMLCTYQDEWGMRTIQSPVDQNYVYHVDDVLITCSSDGGIRWRNPEHFFWRSSMISEDRSSIAIHPENPEIVYVAKHSELAITRNGCERWEYPTQLEALNVNSVVINPENPDIVYAATDAGVFISDDGGYGWGQVNDGLLGALVVYSVTIDPNNPENVYASTPYGIFKLEDK